MKKTVKELIEGFKTLLAVRPVYTNETTLMMYQLRNHIQKGAIIFDPVNAEYDYEDDVEKLFNQAVLTGVIINTYRGYADDEGNIHIVNARNLQLLIEDPLLFNEQTDFQLLRRIKTASVRVFYIESDNNQKIERRKTIGDLLGFSNIN